MYGALCACPQVSARSLACVECGIPAAVSARYETVTVDRVTRVYGATRALAGISLIVHAGQVTSVEGGNGAGKSTLLAVLATLSRPTVGTVTYGNLTAPDDLVEIRRSIGLVGHEAMVYPDLTARESLRLMAVLHEIDAPRECVESALDAAALREFADRPARTLSRGQLQRLSLARAQLHDPALLLFDEPTTGLDAAATSRVEASLARARARGRIIVVVTHDKAFAERVSDVRVTLDRGRILAVDGPRPPT